MESLAPLLPAWLIVAPLVLGIVDLMKIDPNANETTYAPPRLVAANFGSSLDTSLPVQTTPATSTTR